MTPRHDDNDSTFPENARRQAIEAYEHTRDNLSEAGRKAKDSLSEAPLIALAGGIAAGALIAALLPRTDKETELVGPTAKRVKKTAKAAAEAARETGSKHLSELGISKDKGEQTLRSLLSGVGEAAKASADAALGAARKR